MRMMLTPVSASPARMVGAIGEAPRQRGSSEAWTLRPPWGGTASSSTGRIWPKAATTRTSGRACLTRSITSGLRTRSGSSTGTPAASAAAATGDRRRLMPRPAGRSGRLITRVTGWCSRRAWSEGTANSGVPMKATRMWREPGPGLRLDRRGLGFGRLPDRLGGDLGSDFAEAFGAGQAVPEEDAVDVVDLMLEAARQQAVGPHTDVLAGPVLGLDHHPLVALDLTDVAGDGEAALVADLLALGADDLGVDEGMEMVLDLADDNSQQHPYLRRRQPDPGSVAHGVDHVVDQPANGVIDLGYLGALSAKAGVVGDHDVTNHEQILRVQVHRRPRRGRYLP